MRILCNILVVLFVTTTAVGQQINPVPDYIFRNSMSVGRNAPTDTSAYFSIGPRFGATRGFMPPMVVDTAAVTGTKRNGLLIYSIQRNSFLYWDSTGMRWSRIAANLDTLLLSTRAWRQKGDDSLAARINLRLNISDTATMLSPYVRIAGFGLTKGTQTLSADSASMATRARVQKGIDSVAALSRVGGSGTINRVPKFTASGTIGDGSIADSSTSVRMTILSGGNIGVATAAPAYNFDVAGSLRNTTNAFFNTSSGESYFGTTTDAGDFRVQISGNQYVSGNVGIGTSSVASGFKLGVQDVINISGTNPYLNFNANSGSFTSKAYIQYQESIKQLAIASSDTSTSTIVLQTGNPVTTKMTITGSGNVGIGKTPSYKLDVDGIINTTQQVYAVNTATDPTTNNTTTNGTVFSLNAANTTNSFGIGIGALRNSVYDIWFKTGTNGGGYRWYINLTEQMTLTNTGNLGIGTTTASEKLHVVGRARVTTIDSSASPINMLWADNNGVVRKTAVPTASVSGGTTDFIPLWSSSTALTSSIIKQVSSEILVDYASDQGAFKLQVNGAALADGGYRSGAPNGGTAATWKLGIVVAGSYTAASNYLQVDVGGTLYYIGLVTPN
jgi:hypothetical protein